MKGITSKISTLISPFLCIAQKGGAIRYMLGTLLLACFKRVLGHPVKSETVGFFARRQTTTRVLTTIFGSKFYLSEL